MYRLERTFRPANPTRLAKSRALASRSKSSRSNAQDSRSHHDKTRLDNPRDRHCRASCIGRRDLHHAVCDVALKPFFPAWPHAPVRIRVPGNRVHRYGFAMRRPLRPPCPKCGMNMISAGETEPFECLRCGYIEQVTPQRGLPSPIRVATASAKTDQRVHKPNKKGPPRNG